MKRSLFKFQRIYFKINNITFLEIHFNYCHSDKIKFRATCVGCNCARYRHFLLMSKQHVKTYVLYNIMSGIQIFLEDKRMLLTPPNSAGSHFKYSSSQRYKHTCNRPKLHYNCVLSFKLGTELSIKEMAPT